MRRPLALFLAVTMSCPLGAAPAPDPLEAAAARVLPYRQGYTDDLPVDLLARLPEGGLDEAEAVLLSLARHPILRAAGSRRDAVLGDVTGARLYPNPSFELEAEEVEPGANLGGAEFNALLRQQILTAGRLGKRVRAAERQREVAGWAYLETGVALAAEVRAAFLRVLAARELVSISQEQVGLAKELVSIVARRLVAGATNLAEKLRAESFLASVETRLLQAQATLGVSEASLRGLLPGVPANPEWQGDLPIPAEPPRTAPVLPEIDELSPSLQRLARSIQAARARLVLARTGRRPNVEVGLGVRRNRAIDDTSYLASFGVPLPVRDRNQGGIVRARAEIAEAEANLDAERLRVRARIEGLSVRLTRLLEQIRTYRDVVLPKARQALELSRAGYQRGKFPYLNVLDAQRELASALGDELQLRLQYALTRVQLDQALGYPRDTRL